MPNTAAIVSAFTKNQPVLVSYGVEIGWDVATSSPVIVTAHASALSAL